ncbi:MAG: beta/gamma crystallin-related protein [Pseudomonadota bacterium]
MKELSKIALAVAGLVLVTQAAAQVTFYENEGFAGRSFTTQGEVRSFQRAGFNDRASSVIVRSERWEVCEDDRFRGRCVVLRRGQYPSLAAMGLNDRISSVRAINRSARVDDDRYAPAPPPVQMSQVTFYEHEGFQGRSFTTEGALPSLQRAGFNDRASSVVVRGERWEVCSDDRFRGQCVVLRRGQYPSLAAMGLNDRVSSVRTVATNARIDDGRFAPPPMAVYDYGRRPNERLYQANITSVRAVVGAPTQRCWVEREQVVQDTRSQPNVGGAVLGAVIGGILGHQVGGGSGRDAATAVGVVAGAAIGGNTNRDSGGQQVVSQNVQRCTSAPNQARPEYWDVTYNFRGMDHRVQMTTPPGATVTVNEQGEPRA